ncbi:hypothetical protein BH11PSE7_BH11PSE7_13630 [soil metagenome]
MKLTRHLALLAGLAVVLLCSWLGPMDEPASAQVDAGLKSALVSFASARAINAVLSVVQAAQVDIQPAGVGVTLSPGQLLAPVNELVKHFADLMLLACIAFGIQKFLIAISGFWMISAALTLVALGWAACHIRQRQAPAWLSRALILMLMLRFAVPVAMLGTEALAQKFLQADYAAAQQAIDVTASEAGKVKEPEPAPSGSSSWLPKMPEWLPGVTVVKERYGQMRQVVERSTEHIVKLMVIFLLQTLLLPLLIVWGLFTVARGMVEWPRLRAPAPMGQSNATKINDFH